MSYALRNALSRDDEFQGRVRVALARTLAAAFSEAADTANHAARVDCARRLRGQAATLITEAALFVASQSAVAVSGTVDAPTTDLSDAALQAAIDALFAGMAVAGA